MHTIWISSILFRQTRSATPLAQTRAACPYPGFDEGVRRLSRRAGIRILERHWSQFLGRQHVSSLIGLIVLRRNPVSCGGWWRSYRQGPQRQALSQRSFKVLRAAVQLGTKVRRRERGKLRSANQALSAPVCQPTPRATDIVHSSVVLVVQARRHGTPVWRRRHPSRTSQALHGERCGAYDSPPRWVLEPPRVSTVLGLLLRRAGRGRRSARGCSAGVRRRRLCR